MMTKQDLYILAVNYDNHIIGYKIGISDNIVERIKQLQSGCPLPIYLYKKYEVDNARNFESMFHNKFKETKLMGEWFYLNQTELDYMANIIKKYKNKPMNRNLYSDYPIRQKKKTKYVSNSKKYTRYIAFKRMSIKTTLKKQPTYLWCVRNGYEVKEGNIVIKNGIEIEVANGRKKYMSQIS